MLTWPQHFARALSITRDNYLCQFSAQIIITSSRILPSEYRSDEFLNRRAKSLNIQASPRASSFVRNLFATT